MGYVGCRAKLAALTVLGTALLAVIGARSEGGATPEEYVSQVGGDARIVPVGELKIDGYKVLCGRRPTVLDSKLDDYGAAFPGPRLRRTQLSRRGAPVSCRLTPACFTDARSSVGKGRCACVGYGVKLCPWGRAGCRRGSAFWR